MGCASSKPLQMQAEVHGWDAPHKGSPLQSFAQSIKTPLSYSKSPEQNPFHVVALTSSTYGALRMGLETNAASKLAISSHYKAELKHESHSSPSTEIQRLIEMKVSSVTEALKPTEVTDMIDVKKLMEDLEQDEGFSPTESTRKKSMKVYGRSFSMPEAQNSQKLDREAYRLVDLSEDIPLPKPATAIHVQKGRLESKYASSSLLSSRKSIKGLFYGASLFSSGELESRNLVTDGNHHKIVAVSAHANETSRIVADGYSTPSADDSESLNFDLEILNSVEKALLGLVRDDDWCYVTSDGEDEASSKMEISTMTKCLFPEPEDEHLAGGTASNKKNKIPLALEAINKAFSNKKFSSSKVSALEVEEKKLNVNGLEKFELRCPPGGEDRVVLYFTSLRGIRKTYEDCSNARMTLQGFSVKIDERDVSMHFDFRKELKDILEKPVQVPRIFIRGRYIGGVEELLQLNEDDVLVKLLEGLPRETSGQICEGCGGARFIPCLKCSGSCKLLSDISELVRCPDCNENGLLRCPICF